MPPRRRNLSASPLGPGDPVRIGDRKGVIEMTDARYATVTLEDGRSIRIDRRLLGDQVEAKAMTYPPQNKAIRGSATKG